MPSLRWPLTEWGIKLTNFKLRYSITIKEIAEASGVKVTVLRQVMIGKIPGYIIIDKVEKFMEEYEAANEVTQPRLSPIDVIR